MFNQVMNEYNRLNRQMLQDYDARTGRAMGAFENRTNRAMAGYLQRTGKTMEDYQNMMTGGIDAYDTMMGQSYDVYGQGMQGALDATSRGRDAALQAVQGQVSNLGRRGAEMAALRGNAFGGGGGAAAAQASLAGAGLQQQAIADYARQEAGLRGQMAAGQAGILGQHAAGGLGARSQMAGGIGNMGMQQASGYGGMGMQQATGLGGMAYDAAGNLMQGRGQHAAGLANLRTGMIGSGAGFMGSDIQRDWSEEDWDRDAEWWAAQYPEDDPTGEGEGGGGDPSAPKSRADKYKALHRGLTHLMSGGASWATGKAADYFDIDLPDFTDWFGW
jgi:hypothetical protein